MNLMAKLTDYLDPNAIAEIEESFRAATGQAVRICQPDGRALIEGEPLPAPTDPNRTKPEEQDEAPVVVNGETIAVIRLGPQDRPAARMHTANGPMIRLMADQVGRLCRQQDQLQTRVGELAGLYRLTAQFAVQKDLQALLDLVADTVVQTLKAKGCTIRLLSDNRRDLAIKAVANLSPVYLDKGSIRLADSQIDREVLDSLQCVYVADERTDPRVLYPAEARREGIVSALCAPLVYHGRPEGVLHVYTGEPHEFDWFEVSLLQAIAVHAAAAIVNARLSEQAVQGAETKRYIRLAGIVQRRMIPAQPPHLGEFDIGAVYVPCFELGGDFYDFIDLPEENLALAVCDVVGKGVRASLLMASIRASLRAHATEVYDMSEVLAKVNRTLCADSAGSDFATLFYAVLDRRLHRITYATAGHIPPLLFRDGQPRRLSTGGGVLGVNEFARWEHDWLTWRSGDVLLAYTDGLSEAMNFDDEVFGHPRVQAAGADAIERGCDAKGIVKHVLWEMRRFAGLHTRFDDLTIVAIKVL